MHINYPDCIVNGIQRLMELYYVYTLWSTLLLARILPLDISKFLHFQHTLCAPQNSMVTLHLFLKKMNNGGKEAKGKGCNFVGCLVAVIIIIVLFKKQQYFSISSISRQGVCLFYCYFWDKGITVFCKTSFNEIEFSSGLSIIRLINQNVTYSRTPLKIQAFRR